MEYKYPKKITIGDTKFKIIYDYKTDNGASFRYPVDGKKGFVKFGMKHHKANPLQFLSLVLHEFKEIIQMEQSVCLYNRGIDNYEFHYGHAEHTDLCCRLTGILKKFIK